MAEQKEESKKEPTEEYAGFGKEVFVFKKEAWCSYKSRDNHGVEEYWKPL